MCPRHPRPSQPLRPLSDPAWAAQGHAWGLFFAQRPTVCWVVCELCLLVPLGDAHAQCYEPGSRETQTGGSDSNCTTLPCRSLGSTLHFSRLQAATLHPGRGSEEQRPPLRSPLRAEQLSLERRTARCEAAHSPELGARDAVGPLTAGVYT